MLSISHVPERLATRLTRRQLGRQAVLTALEEIGIKACDAEQTTTAVAADAVAAQHLDIEPTSALLCIRRLSRDLEGRSIEHHTYLYRPDRFHLRARIDVERTPAGAGWANAGATPLIPSWL